MRTSSRFGTRVVEIPITSTNQIVKVIPVGDIHYGAETHAKDRFDEFCRYARGLKNAYFILMGDYLELFSATERRTLLKAFADDNLRENAKSELEGMVSRQMRDLLKKIEFMRGRTLAVLDGNHTFQFDDGLLADQKIAQFLESEWLGVMGCILMRFDYHGCHSSITIWAHHGRGGFGKTPGNQINTIDDFAQWCGGGDIYLMGDNHGRVATLGRPILLPYMNPSTHQLDVREHVPFLGRTGSFLKGYVPGKKSYIVEKAMRPHSLGHIEFDIQISRAAGKDNHGRDKVTHPLSVVIRGIS